MLIIYLQQIQKQSMMFKSLTQHNLAVFFQWGAAVCYDVTTLWEKTLRKSSERQCDTRSNQLVAIDLPYPDQLLKGYNSWSLPRWKNRMISDCWFELSFVKTGHNFFPNLIKHDQTFMYAVVWLVRNKKGLN